MWTNTELRWGSLARLFHWGLALALFGMMALGWIAESMRLSPAKVKLFVWHKSFGILILLLVALRLVWRLSQTIPRDPPGMAPLERRLASLTHIMLYVLMFAMPLSGWVINSASDFPLKLFWLVPLPAIVEPSPALEALAKQLHLAGFWTLAVLVTLHVVAALRHHFVLRDDVLLRMLGEAEPPPKDPPQ